MSLREEQAELFRPTIEPQDYEMVEFFIKRLKLWMGITKAKQVNKTLVFNHFIMNIKIILLILTSSFSSSSSDTE